jgi:general secretion pathway protein D
VRLLIAEVTTGNGFTWNPSFTVLDIANKQGDTGVSGGSRLVGDTQSLIGGAASGMLPQGLTAAVSHDAVTFDANGNLTGGSFPGILSIEALKSDSNLKIISETALQAQNNIEAEVKIVDDIPYLKSSVEGSGSDRDYIQNIDRMEVGVTLKFTPYIVPGNSVRMVLEPTIASVVGTTTDSLNPTIAKRSANTTVTVPDGNTIVIAGLTRTATKKVEHRIPILGYIPLLGWLFRYKSDVEETTNLLIFVTPTIVATPADASAPSALWQQKTGITPDDGERGTGNGERGTGNQEPGTRNQEPGTRN